MSKRFFKVMAMDRKQTEIELDGKSVPISKKERNLARIGLYVMEFMPIFAMMLILNNLEALPLEDAGTIMGFLFVTLYVFGVFVIGALIGYLIYRIGMRSELK